MSQKEYIIELIERIRKDSFCAIKAMREARNIVIDKLIIVE